MATENVDLLIDTSTDRLISERSKLLTSGSAFLPARRQDIVGIDGVVEQVDQIIHWLVNAKEYRRAGARLEPGVIFYGSPGTGKTLVARYLASNAKSRFINVRDWPIEGETMAAEDLRTLFAGARRVYAEENIPVVLFWDEFESHAGDRDELSGAEADVVAQLTAELDGIHGKNDGLLLIGCTNYIHVIDEALSRPGRMGVTIYFETPNKKGRRLLLEHYLKNRPLDQIDFNSLESLLEPGTSASAIEEICVQAWTEAVREGIQDNRTAKISEQQLLRVLVDRLIGARQQFQFEAQWRRQVAIHELGHALAARLLGQKIVVAAVRSTPVGPGIAITDDNSEGRPEMIADYEKQIIIALSGSIAEDICSLGRLAGYDHDLEKATSMAHRLTDMLSHHTPSQPLSLFSLSSRRQEVTEGPTLSNELLAASDQRIGEILAEAYQEGHKLLNHIGRDHIEALANILTDSLILTGKQIENYLEDEQIELPPLGERVAC